MPSSPRIGAVPRPPAPPRTRVLPVRGLRFAEDPLRGPKCRCDASLETFRRGALQGEPATFRSGNIACLRRAREAPRFRSPPTLGKRPPRPLPRRTETRRGAPMGGRTAASGQGGKPPMVRGGCERAVRTAAGVPDVVRSYGADGNSYRNRGRRWYNGLENQERRAYARFQWARRLVGGIRARPPSPFRAWPSHVRCGRRGRNGAQVGSAAFHSTTPRGPRVDSGPGFGELVIQGACGNVAAVSDLRSRNVGSTAARRCGGRMIQGACPVACLRNRVVSCLRPEFFGLTLH